MLNYEKRAVSSSQADAQYSGNIRWVFPQCCNTPGIQGTFQEYVKGKYYLTNSVWKVVFMLKGYDLTIANVDLLANSSNHKAMLPEYSKNIQRIFISKMFQWYPRNIVMSWKCFYKVKKFCGLPWEIFNIGSLLSWNVYWNLIETVFYWEKVN